MIHATERESGIQVPALTSNFHQILIEVVYYLLQEATDSNTRKQSQAELEWELQCVLDEMAEESISVTNGNGHVLNTRTTCEQNGAVTDEISPTNGHLAPQTGMRNFRELPIKPHIQQRLQAYRESKQSRIDKFLEHLDNKQKQYLQNICPKVM